MTTSPDEGPEIGVAAVTTEGARTLDRETWRLGPLAFRDRIEPVVRSIVAERMGVSSDDLLADVSFEQDLAAPPSDVTALVVVIEQAIGLHVSEVAIDRVRTYGDLVDVIVDARSAIDDPTPPRVLLRTVLVSGRRERRGVLVRTGWSTPYGLASIADEARHAGSGACLVVTLPDDVAVADAARIEHALSPLVARGVTLRIHRAQDARGRAVA